MSDRKVYIFFVNVPEVLLGLYSLLKFFLNASLALSLYNEYDRSPDASPHCVAGHERVTLATHTSCPVGRQCVGSISFFLLSQPSEDPLSVVKAGRESRKEEHWSVTLSLG